MSEQAQLKVFSTSAAETESVPAGEDQTVMVDDVQVTFAAPTTSHLILMASMLEGAKDEKRRASILINWFFSMVPAMQRGYFETRLFDHEDSFDLVNITDIIDYLMEQWSGGRPTQRSSTSSGSPKPGGKKSTGKRHGQAHRRGASTSGSGAASSTGGPAAEPAMKAETSSAP